MQCKCEHSLNFGSWQATDCTWIEEACTHTSSIIHCDYSIVAGEQTHLIVLLVFSQRRWQAVWCMQNPLSRLLGSTHHPQYGSLDSTHFLYRTISVTDTEPAPTQGYNRQKTKFVLLEGVDSIALRGQLKVMKIETLNRLIWTGFSWHSVCWPTAEERREVRHEAARQCSEDKSTHNFFKDFLWIRRHPIPCP